jgi:hypothetical protein
MDNVRVSTLGPQVLLDGEHLATARDDEAAFVIAWCLNTARASYPYTDAEERRVQEFFA